jgi:hypothetical protein
MMCKISKHTFEKIVDFDFSNIHVDNHKLTLITQFFSLQPKNLNAIKIVFNQYSFDD